MLWGCMSSHGVGRLRIVSGTVKAMNYIEILQNKLLPTARDIFSNQSWIFQDDNALCHRAKVVQKWLKNYTVNRMNWPGQSPDRNPDIAERLGCTAHDCWEKWSREDTISRKPGSNHVQAATYKEDRRIQRMAVKHRTASTGEIATSIDTRIENRTSLSLS
ncbi:transposable element Tcb1 transposase [Trichonephila clavipes]|nr:transposable element Tcb1 transposase [Trichonephila clavipes]